jgi:hypothetical protein
MREEQQMPQGTGKKEANYGSEKPKHQPKGGTYKRFSSINVVKTLTKSHSKDEQLLLQLKGIGGWADAEYRGADFLGSQRGEGCGVAYHDTGRGILPLVRWLSEDRKTQPWNGIEQNNDRPTESKIDEGTG